MVRISPAICFAMLAVVATSGAGSAKEKPKRTESRAADCARAAYPGDPVCDADGEVKALPLPTSRRIRRTEEGSGFVVGDRVTLDGKTNFNENRFGEAPLHKFTPRPDPKASRNGGAQLDYRF